MEQNTQGAGNLAGAIKGQDAPEAGRGERCFFPPLRRAAAGRRGGKSCQMQFTSKKGLSYGLETGKIIFTTLMKDGGTT